MSDVHGALLAAVEGVIAEGLANPQGWSCVKCGGADRYSSGECKACARRRSNARRAEKVAASGGPRKKTPLPDRKLMVGYRADEVCARCGASDRNNRGECKPCIKTRKKSSDLALVANATPCRKCGAIDRYAHGPCRPCDKRRRALQESREARSLYKVAWYERNKERLVISSRQRYLDNRDEHLAKCAERYRRDKTGYLARHVKWVIDHPEESRAIKNAWAARNPESIAARAQRRRSREAGAEGSFTAREWADKKAEHSFRCVDCGLLEGSIIGDGKSMKLTVGHALPLSKKGSNYIFNIIPQCPRCNWAQGSKVHVLAKVAA